MKILEWARRHGSDADPISLARMRAPDAPERTGLPPAWVEGIRGFYDELHGPRDVTCTGTACHFAGDRSEHPEGVHCYGRCYEAPARPSERHRLPVQHLPEVLDVDRIGADEQRRQVEIDRLLRDPRRERRVADADMPRVGEDLDDEPAVEAKARAQARTHRYSQPVLTTGTLKSARATAVRSWAETRNAEAEVSRYVIGAGDSRRAAS